MLIAILRVIYANSNSSVTCLKTNISPADFPDLHYKFASWFQNNVLMQIVVSLF